MSDNPELQKAREFFGNLNAEAEAIWTVAREQNPALTDDELVPIVREIYVRHHSPALFRVGVTFTQEQQAKIKSLVQQSKIAEAQRLILDDLQNELDEE